MHFSQSYGAFNAQSLPLHSETNNMQLFQRHHRRQIRWRDSDDGLHQSSALHVSGHPLVPTTLTHSVSLPFAHPGNTASSPSPDTSEIWTPRSRVFMSTTKKISSVVTSKN